jgi:putative ABC transport system permease protein
MRNLMQDVRYGIRVLLKNPGFTLVAVATLALGIGANSAMFTVVNAVLLKPFSFYNPERLVVLWERSVKQGLPRMVVSPPNFADWRNQNQVFQDVAAYRLQDFNVLTANEPELVRGLRVSATMFSLLGVQPALGRDFQPDEDQPGKPATVIISNEFWRSRFNASQAVIGRSITLGSEGATIIGVMPADFDFPPPIAFRGEARAVKVHLWTPLRYSLELDQRGAHNLFVLARLKDGVTQAHAEADLHNISDRLAKEFPETNDGWDGYLVPLHEQVIGDVKTALWILPIAVGFVLLIACANVANLLLVRATRRQREMAIRAALGAGRFTLIRQMLVENVLLAVIAGAIGLVLAVWVLKLISALAPQNIYRLDALSIDSRVVIYTVLVSFLTSLLFGSIPALQVSRINLVNALKGGATVTGKQATRSFFVIAEVALALVLLTGAGLLVNSFIRLQSVPVGFQPEQVVTMTLNLPRASYPDMQARVAFIDRLMPRLATLPGLKSAAFGSNVPLDVGLQGTEFKIESQPVDPENVPHTQVSIVSPGYFQTLGISILQGRDFARSDTHDSRGVVIINSDLARKYFGAENPIGRRLEMGFRSGVPLEIVGVTADVRQTGLQADPQPGMFLPYTQYQSSLPLVFVFRSASDQVSAAAAVRQEMRQLDPQLPLYNVKTMDQVLYTATARPRFLTFLLVLFAGLAVLLAAIGIYGIMSYTVAQGTREIGIRVALGAQSRDLFQMVLGRGLRLTLIGIILGVAGAFGLTRLMSNLLFGVSATDPLTFMGVAVLLVIVALLASYIPARRATKVDPLVALRYE